MLLEAPFHADLADAPEGSRAYWVQTQDNLRIRVGHFPGPADARGTVLLFPGRTEFVEKYGRVASDLADRGYHTMAVDWRGQGLADRMLGDARTGHVHLFGDYQTDVAAAVAAAEVLDLPKPWFLHGHSMGGCIGLRALTDGLPVAACSFSGPMWGIRIAAPVRPAAWALSWSVARVGLGHVYAPSTGPGSYVADSAFEDNQLTTDRESWEWMQNQVRAVPEFQLGGPSLRWLHQALAEMLALARLPSPDMPCISFLGSNERIVDPGRVRTRMAQWPGGRLEMVQGGEHEVLMEDPVTRGRIASQMADLFASAPNGSGRKLTA